jgi:hypothetical protein
MSQPNWVDYVNVGANIANLEVNTAQLQSLQQIQSQLARLAQIEANREQRLEFESELRQFVFDQETKLEEVRAEDSANPIARWVSVQLIKRNLASIPVTAASFQEFVDKDRVRKLNAELVAAAREYEAKLDSKQINDARSALQFVSESAALGEYIEMQEAIEFLAVTEQEYDNLGRSVAKTDTMIALGLLLALTIPPLILFGFGRLVSGFLTNRQILLTGEQAELGFVLLAVLSGSLFCLGVLWVAVQIKHSKPAKSRLEDLESRRIQAAKRLPSKNQQERLIEQFGHGLTSQQLMQLKDDREAQRAALLV